MNTRVKKLQDKMLDLDIDLIFIDNPENVGYFTGFHSDPHERVMALVVFSEAAPFLFAPALDVEDAKKSAWTEDIIGYGDHEDPFQIIASEIKKRQADGKAMGIEEESLSVARFKALSERLNVEEFQDITSVIQGIRLIKSEDEKNLLLAAGETADLALSIGFQSLKEGVTEAEVVANIEYEMKKRGIDMSFETMVLFGDHAANPHGVPGDRELKKGELVLFDLGTYHENYASDVTRTVAFGGANDQQTEIYQIVRRANAEAIQAVKPGITAEELDAVARDIIEEAGYGQYFNHRLGHGIGQSLHEFPSIVQGNDLVIQEGMCFSIEPGIYIPGQVGVRIEDCVYVTADGCEVFTSTPKELNYIYP